MKKDALEYIYRLSVDSLEPHRLINGDRVAAYCINGAIHTIAKEIPPRQHNAKSLSSLISLANRFAESEELPPVVWVSDDRITLVINDNEYRNDVVQFDLEYSDAFRVIRSLASEKLWLEQRPFIRMLRIDLAGCLAPGVLLDRVRKLRFEQGQVVNSESARNRESLGREIIAKIDANGELPEVVTLTAPVYKLGDKYEIDCAVDTDASRGLLQLIPLPDEVDRVVDRAVNAIVAQISEAVADGVHVYRGAP